MLQFASFLMGENGFWAHLCVGQINVALRYRVVFDVVRTVSDGDAI